MKIVKNVKESGISMPQEIFPVMQNIYRKYPNKITFENSLQEIMDNYESAEENDARSAAIWILGEYAEKIPNSVQMISKKIEKYKF
jgi:AP-2 complex subunit beta-1